MFKSVSAVNLRVKASMRPVGSGLGHGRGAAEAGIRRPTASYFLGSQRQPSLLSHQYLRLELYLSRP